MVAVSFCIKTELGTDQSNQVMTVNFVIILNHPLSLFARFSSRHFPRVRFLFEQKIFCSQDRFCLQDRFQHLIILPLSCSFLTVTRCRWHCSYWLWLFVPHNRQQTLKHGVPDFHLCVLRICDSVSSLSIIWHQRSHILNLQKWCFVSQMW